MVIPLISIINMDLFDIENCDATTSQCRDITKNEWVSRIDCLSIARNLCRTKKQHKTSVSLRT